MTRIHQFQIFILGFAWGILSIKVLPLLIKDMVSLFGELFKLIINKIKKHPADSTAERNQENNLKYSITDYPINFYNQPLDRWS